LAPRCRRESHAYTDPITGAIDQWRVVINRAYKSPSIAGGFKLSPATAAGAETEGYGGAAAAADKADSISPPPFEYEPRGNLLRAR